MKVFITHTFRGLDNKLEVENLCRIVRDSGAEDYSFIRDVENYTKIFTTPNQMMSVAKKSISQCDALLFDLTDPSAGKCIEAGIAYQLGKKIIVIKHKDAENRNTVLGIADIVIEYENIQDIQADLANYILKTK